MFLSYLTLFVALSLSVVAAFYSIAGLAAIFAAAVVPIIIMGSILEVAKIVTTLWLHEYWRQAKLSLKLYLVPAVAILMVLTSMGIFGFLSKAHLDQAVPVGDVVSQVALFDEKIANERETIANARTLLGQLDKAVADISASPDREVNGRVISSAERALQVRRQQARDRASLTRTIEESQARIVKLQEERAPIASQARKVEAEVGPIKYVAALIYGDNPDANLLERAVRWVIIIIVIVFDPLAIMMLLAATESMSWHRSQKRKDDSDDNPVSTSVPTESSDDLDPVGHPPGDSVAEPPLPKMEPRPEPEVPYQILEDFSEPDPEPMVPTHQQLNLDDEEEDSESSIIKQAKWLWKQDNPTQTLKEQRRLLAIGQIQDLPWMSYLDDPRIILDAGFGKQLPKSAQRGDQFVLTDSTPTRLFKFNGNAWIEVDKNLSDNYTYNQAYIDHLITRISKGEYDPDMLTNSERSQIEERLRKSI